MDGKYAPDGYRLRGEFGCSSFVHVYDDPVVQRGLHKRIALNVCGRLGYVGS
jgi:hypothetical protein